VNVEGADLSAGLRTASVFLVNRRTAATDIRKDEAFAFQSCLEIQRSTSSATPTVRAFSNLAATS
jgi:hypothetical protein